MIQHEKALDLWRNLIATGELPDEVATEAKAALKTYDRSDDLLIAKTKQLRELSNELVNVRRAVPDVIHDAIAAGKKPAIEATSEQITLLESAVADAEQQQRIAERATTKAGSALESGIVRRHRDQLIVWVASRRMTSPHACGLTDVITKDLETVWAKLDVNLYPVRDEALALPEHWSRLPIVIDPQWPRDIRSSVTWCWKQIAESRWEWEAHPNNRQGVKHLMRFTTLPTIIEQAPDIPAKRQRRLTFGMGKA